MNCLWKHLYVLPSLPSHTASNCRSQRWADGRESLCRQNVGHPGWICSRKRLHDPGPQSGWETQNNHMYRNMLGYKHKFSTIFQYLFSMCILVGFLPFPTRLQSGTNFGRAQGFLTCYPITLIYSSNFCARRTITTVIRQSHLSNHKKNKWENQKNSYKMLKRNERQLQDELQYHLAGIYLCTPVKFQFTPMSVWTYNIAYVVTTLADSNKCFSWRRHHDIDLYDPSE